MSNRLLILSCIPTSQFIRRCGVSSVSSQHLHLSLISRPNTVRYFFYLQWPMSQPVRLVKTCPILLKAGIGSFLDKILKETVFLPLLWTVFQTVSFLCVSSFTYNKKCRESGWCFVSGQSICFLTSLYSCETYIFAKYLDYLILFFDCIWTYFPGFSATKGDIGTR